VSQNNYALWRPKSPEQRHGKIKRALSAGVIAIALVAGGSVASYADSISPSKGASTAIFTRYNAKKQQEAQAKFDYVNVIRQATAKTGYYSVARGWIRDRMPKDSQKAYAWQTAEREQMTTNFGAGGYKVDVAKWKSGGTQEANTRTALDKEVSVSANVYHFKDLPGGLTGRWRSKFAVCVDVKWAPDACASPSPIVFTGLWRTM
jgi:hypothetical protein